jgi:hypothetical protein
MTVAIGTYVSLTALQLRTVGTADTTDSALQQTIVDQVNTYIETTTGRVIAPIASGTVTFDIPVSTSVLYVKEGVRAITSLEVADYTGGTYTTVGTADYFLRPLAPRPGWPYTEIHISDVPTGSVSAFSAGYSTVRLVGTRGWAEVPEDLEDVAITLAVRAWHSREAGQQDIVGTDEMGRPLVSRFLSRRDRETLHRYTIPASAA